MDDDLAKRIEQLEERSRRLKGTVPGPPVRARPRATQAPNRMPVREVVPSQATAIALRIGYTGALTLVLLLLLTSPLWRLQLPDGSVHDLMALDVLEEFAAGGLAFVAIAALAPWTPRRFRFSTMLVGAGAPALVVALAYTIWVIDGGPSLSLTLGGGAVWLLCILVWMLPPVLRQTERRIDAGTP